MQFISIDRIDGSGMRPVARRAARDSWQYGAWHRSDYATVACVTVYDTKTKILQVEVVHSRRQ